MFCFTPSRKKSRIVHASHCTPELDPERSLLSSNAVLFPNQLRELHVQPKYVVSIGSAPAERSTIAPLAHFDDQELTRFSMYEQMEWTKRQKFHPPIPSKEWFPEFRCAPTGTSSVIQALCNSNCGPPWALLGKIRTEATILRCIRTTETTATVGLIRFERRDEPITVTPLPEETYATDLSVLRSMHQSKLYTIILFEDNSEASSINDFNTLAYSITLRNLCMGRGRWNPEIEFVRRTTDADFAAYGEYLTTFWKLDVEDDSCTRIGIGAVYAGADERIDSMLAEILMHDSATMVDRPHSPYNNDTEFSQIDFCLASPGPLPGNFEAAGQTEDTYGWICASESKELGSSPDVYLTSVASKRMLTVRAGASPCYRYTRETVSRLSRRVDICAPTLANERHDCDCDGDEEYAKKMSEALRSDLKWVVETYSQLRNDFSVAEAISGWTEKLNSSVRNTLPLKRDIPPIRFFAGLSVGWLHRYHPFATVVPNVPARGVRHGRLDLLTERIVARSDMPALCVPKCGDVSILKPVNLRKRWIDGDTRHRLLSAQHMSDNVDIDSGDGGPAQELCFMVFVGTDMHPIVRKFFSADWSRSGKRARSTFMKNLSDTVCRIGVPLEHTKPELVFVLSLALVSCNTENGARTCIETLFSFGGAVLETNILIHAINQLLPLCDVMAVSGISRLAIIESIPELGTVPYRCVLQATPHITACLTPKVVRCMNYGILLSHWEECVVRDSKYIVNVPTQTQFVTSLTRCPHGPVANDWYLGFFFPFKGFRVITVRTRRWLAAYTYRFRKWLQWEEGSPHYVALRRLVPLCDCYLMDACMTNNFFACGMLFHLHCVPIPAREKRIVAILARAIDDAQTYAGTSLHVDTSEQ
ncbi:LORF5 protein [Gallid alphaherpesvirus 3]|nr:protein LORF5 [Gallid alphaherpesvirus 3]YP_010795658.1 ORF996 protein [Gallid alphaherpesvirus 3]BAA33007.1 glycoprotein [Gallid alphaherpesvirus 1]AEI00267.1 ORF996 protein [Gallid alphaherpesvirus 3]QEY02218.1 ORF996 protein [Gallid alphaherpesvirus 3]BAB16568.1 LORF5 protein [Gallid alphaherpesvirus 3]